MVSFYSLRIQNYLLLSASWSTVSLYLYFPFPQCNEKLMIYPPPFQDYELDFSKKNTKKASYEFQSSLFMIFPWHSAATKRRKNFLKRRFTKFFRRFNFPKRQFVSAPWRFLTMLSNSLFSETFFPALFSLFRKLMQACFRPFLHGE